MHHHVLPGSTVVETANARVALPLLCPEEVYAHQLPSGILGLPAGFGNGYITIVAPQAYL